MQLAIDREMGKDDFFWSQSEPDQDPRFLSWLNQLPENGVLLQLYSSTLSAKQASECARFILQHVPQATLIGASLSQLFVESELKPYGFLLVALAAPATGCSLYVQPKLMPLERTGEALLEQLQSPFMVCLAVGLTLRDSAVFQAFDKPGSPEVSGAIALPNDGGEAWVLAGIQTYVNGLVVVGMDKSSALRQGFIPKWYPVGRSMPVTRCEGRRVYEIEGQSCLDLYSDYLGCELPAPQIDLADFPLLGDDGDRYVVAQPDQAKEDGSVVFSQSLFEGEMVRLGYYHHQLIEETVLRHRHRLERQQGAVFVFYCRGCSKLKDTNPQAEVKLLCGERPGFGGLSGGEIVTQRGRVVINHHALSYWAIDRAPALLDEQAQEEELTESYHQQALFHLIGRSLEDLRAQNTDLNVKLDNQQRELLESLVRDKLTGLPNRHALLEDIRRQESVQRINLLVFKIDNFSNINRYYGYEGGDRLLLAISNHLELYAQSRSWADMRCYRTSANEFVMASYRGASQKLFENWSHELLNELQQQDIYSSESELADVLSVTLAGGIASNRQLDPEAYNYPELLVIRAVAACKKAQHNRQLLHMAGVVKREDERGQEIQRWLRRTKRALQEGGIIPYLQPIVDAQTCQMVAVECLMRLQDGDEVYAPGFFLPIIKDTNLYPSVSRAMLRGTIEMMGRGNIPYSVNLSVDDLLNPGTMLMLRELLVEADNKPTLEIVESEQLRQREEVETNLNLLRELGCLLAIDDFGAGYSNWEMMLQLRPDILKIDGSLISQADQNMTLQVMLKSISDMARELNIKTVAEFVESKQEVELMRKLGIDSLQGYYFSKPLPASEIHFD